MFSYFCCSCFRVILTIYLIYTFYEPIVLIVFSEKNTDLRFIILDVFRIIELETKEFFRIIGKLVYVIMRVSIKIGINEYFGFIANFVRVVFDALKIKQ